MTGAAPIDARAVQAGGALRLAGWLALAATPTFAALGVFTVMAGPGPMQAMCAPPGMSGLGGMAPMYALMSLFHLGPWLSLLARRRAGA